MKFIFKIVITVLAFVLAYGYFLHGIKPAEMYEQLMNDLNTIDETEEELTDPEEEELTELYSDVQVNLTVEYMGEIFEYENSGIKFDYFEEKEDEKVHYIPLGSLFLKDYELSLPLEPEDSSLNSYIDHFENGELIQSYDVPFFLYGIKVENFDVQNNDVFEANIVFEEQPENWDF